MRLLLAVGQQQHSLDTSLVFLIHSLGICQYSAAASVVADMFVSFMSNRVLAESSLSVHLIGGFLVQLQALGARQS